MQFLIPRILIFDVNATSYESKYLFIPIAVSLVIMPSTLEFIYSVLEEIICMSVFPCKQYKYVTRLYRYNMHQIPYLHFLLPVKIWHKLSCGIIILS